MDVKRSDLIREDIELLNETLSRADEEIMVLEAKKEEIASAINILREQLRREKQYEYTRAVVDLAHKERKEKLVNVDTL